MTMISSIPNEAGQTKKVLVIMGSPRKKGNSFRIMKRIEEKISALGAVDFDRLFLADAHIEPCRGCFLCLSTGERTAAP